MLERLNLLREKAIPEIADSSMGVDEASEVGWEVIVDSQSVVEDED